MAIHLKSWLPRRTQAAQFQFIRKATGLTSSDEELIALVGTASDRFKLVRFLKRDAVAISDVGRGVQNALNRESDKPGTRQRPASHFRPADLLCTMNAFSTSLNSRFHPGETVPAMARLDDSRQPRRYWWSQSLRRHRAAETALRRQGKGATANQVVGPAANARGRSLWGAARTATIQAESTEPVPRLPAGPQRQGGHPDRPGGFVKDGGHVAARWSSGRLASPQDDVQSGRVQLSGVPVGGPHRSSARSRSATRSTRSRSTISSSATSGSWPASRTWRASAT